MLLRCILQPSDYSSFLIRLGAKHRQIGVVFTFFRDARSKKHPKYRCFWCLRSQQPRYLRCFFCGQHQRKRWYLRSFHHVAIISFFAKGTKSLHNYTNKQQKTIKKRPKLTFARTLTPNVKTQPEGFGGRVVESPMSCQAIAG